MTEDEERPDLIEATVPAETGEAQAPAEDREARTAQAIMQSADRASQQAKERRLNSIRVALRAFDVDRSNWVTFEHVEGVENLKKERCVVWMLKNPLHDTGLSIQDFPTPRSRRVFVELFMEVVRQNLAPANTADDFLRSVTKPSCKSCHGRGIAGLVNVTRNEQARITNADALWCQCVHKSLKKILLNPESFPDRSSTV